MVRAAGTSGHSGDDIDLIKQPRPIALRAHHLGTAQEFQDAVRERRRAGASPRKGKNDQRVLVFLVLRPRFESIAGAGVNLRDSRIDKACRSGGERENRQSGDGRVEVGSAHGAF
jgi:hypothetical protein